MYAFSRHKNMQMYYIQRRYILFPWYGHEDHIFIMLVAWVDFKKQCNNFNHKLVKLARMCVQNSVAGFRSGSPTSEEFQIETGLEQRDLLSPSLFKFA